MSSGNGEITSKVEAVMARVRSKNTAASNGAPQAPTSRFRPGETNIFPEDVYRSLHQARTIGGGIGVDYALGWRTPIVGQVWMLVRRRIHQEIRIYIDSLTGQQSNLNTHLIRVITSVVETLDGLGLRAMKREQLEQASTLTTLEMEVRSLRAEVEFLRSRLAAVDAAAVPASTVDRS